jgi:hypothetical protein
MIRYMPNISSTLWAHKSIEYFDTIEDLKSFIADQRNLFCRAIGKGRSYSASQVELIGHDKDMILGWQNYCSVVLDGRLIGFCGE